MRNNYCWQCPAVTCIHVSDAVPGVDRVHAVASASTLLSSLPILSLLLLDIANFKNVTLSNYQTLAIRLYIFYAICAADAAFWTEQQ